MRPEEIEAIKRRAHHQVEAERLEITKRIQAERLAAYQAEEPSPSDRLQAEWDELERPWTEGWQIK